MFVPIIAISTKRTNVISSGTRGSIIAKVFIFKIQAISAVCALLDVKYADF